MKNTLPIMLLKNFLLLPNQEVKLELNNELSKKIISLSSTEYKNELIVLTPKDQIEEIPDLDDLPDISVVAKIKSSIELPNGNYRVTLRGLFRASLKEFKNNDSDSDILECHYQKLEIPFFDEVKATAIQRKLEKLIVSYFNEADGVSNSILNLIKDIKDLNKYTDIIAASLPLSFDKKISYIEEINPVNRGLNLLDDLNLELEIIKLDEKLEENLRVNLEQNQKEFILREKLHEIEKELGEENPKENDAKEYYEKLNSINISNPNTISKIKNEIKKFEHMNENSPEISSIRNYLDLILNLPWNVSSKDNTNIASIKKSLDKTHFGMKEAKDKVIEYIAAKNRSIKVKSPIICLVGPAGVGKTTFAKSIADSLNKEFYKISVGGLNDSSILNGHKRTYIGANAGKIIEALRRTKTNNPVILIDEVDKMSKDYKGDPSSTLLDILDRSQNSAFIDNYVEEPFDLSNVLFILTANYINDIPIELIDRLEIINLTSYTIFEKIDIAKKYLLPEIYEEHSINAKNIKISDNILKEIINYYTNEAGVRDLRRELVRIVQKLIVLDNLENVKLTSDYLITLLGPYKYENYSIDMKRLPGLVNALAVNYYGGLVLPIEATYYDGDGKIKITGNVDKIMQESIDVSISYILKNKDIFKINDYYFKSKNIHIHMLDASSKKDGPSAGMSITTSLISLILNKEVPKDIAMTGELTLNGYIKKIGSIKEKLVGAYNANIKTIFIPKENHNDLIDVPKEILDKLKIIEVKNYEEVFKEIF